MAGLACHFGREGGEALGGARNVFGAGVARGRDGGAGVVDEIGDHAIERAAQGFGEFHPAAAVGIAAVDVAVELSDERNAGEQIVGVDEAGLETVVGIGDVVGNLVDQIDELGLERRAEIEQIFGEVGRIGGGVIAGMLDDALAHFEGEIEAGEIEIALLEMLDDAQGVTVVLEVIAEAAHPFVEAAFAGVAEGRMADVVGEGERFGEIGVEAEGTGGGAGDLGDLQAVGRPNRPTQAARSIRSAEWMKVS